MKIDMNKYMVITSNKEVKFFNELYKARIYMADATFEQQLSSWLYVLDKENHYICREEL